jgi:hypothetical protein
LSLAVEDMNAAILEERWAGDDAARFARANGALDHGFFIRLLHRLETASPVTFVFVKGHGSTYTQKGEAPPEGRLANKNLSWYKISCLPKTALIVEKPQALVWVFFYSVPEVSHV